MDRFTDFKLGENYSRSTENVGPENERPNTPKIDWHERNVRPENTRPKMYDGEMRDQVYFVFGRNMLKQDEHHSVILFYAAVYWFLCHCCSSHLHSNGKVLLVKV